LQRGEPFHFAGKHYQVSESLFKPSAVQSPHVPIWVAAHWPFKRPLQRAARWDGVLPRPWNAGPITPQVIREIADYIAQRRTAGTPFDICIYGVTEGKDQAQDRTRVREFSTAGATWWIEEISSSRGPLKQIQKRIGAGPPR
jgi:alkanesulfonate monooxygenase SsuD/methylene tetrahydromethanopterin reductase-like flavin-dependent oxidoreductase (luciferase family)